MNHVIRKRVRLRGVTLVEVLIVVAIMSIIAGAVTVLSFGELKRARVRTAAIGAGQVREAARIYQEIDLAGEAGLTCPTVPDLIAARKLDPQRTRDPWGTSYNVTCDGDELHGLSAGSDRRLRTPDDVRDDLSPADVDVIARR